MVSAGLRGSEIGKDVVDDAPGRLDQREVASDVASVANAPERDRAPSIDRRARSKSANRIGA
jgi:hypothetical protein